MKSTRFVALAACLVAACESPTRLVDVAEESTPLAAKPVPGPSITVTELPSLGGAARAHDINDGGTIVGLSIDAAGAGNAVKWTFQSGAWTITQLPDGLSGSAVAINAAGDIVGQKGSNPFRAMLWPAGGGSEVLGCAENLGPDAARAINTAGVIAGYRVDESEDPSLPSLSTAVVWRPGGCREDLPALETGQSAQATGIDAAGNVSGFARDNATNQWAVRWMFNGTAWNTPTKLKDGVHATPEASNAGGDIAGSACFGTPPAGCQAHAVLWPAPGDAVRTDLGTLGGQVSAAYALNSAKEVVGWSWTSKPGTHGFIWSTETGMRALKPLKGHQRSEAYGINDALVGGDGSRQAVGFSQTRSGTQRAVVWRVP
jgi:probable HAF family extracellular repeat protein